MSEDFKHLCCLPHHSQLHLPSCLGEDIHFPDTIWRAYIWVSLVTVFFQSHHQYQSHDSREKNSYFINQVQDWWESVKLIVINKTVNTVSAWANLKTMFTFPLTFRGRFQAIFTFDLYSSSQISATLRAFRIMGLLRSGEYGLCALSMCAIFEHGTTSILPPQSQTWLY